MSMFPGAGAVIYRNEAGEPIGWDTPSEPDPYDAYDEWDDGRDCDDDDESEEEWGAGDPRGDFGHFGDSSRLRRVTLGGEGFGSRPWRVAADQTRGARFRCLAPI